MSEVSTLSEAQENVIAKQNMWIYLLCQSLGQSSAPINIALGGLVGMHLLGDDKSLATAPVTAYNIGVAIGALMASAIMRKIGRRRGFMFGCFVGIAGMVFSGLSIAAGSFWLFCSALLVNGLAGGFVQQYRFAVADRGTDDIKPKMISIVMLAGVAAAIIGPQIVIYASDLAAPVPFAGAFYVAIILFVLSFFALFLLNPSNMATTKEEVNSGGRELSEIMLQPRFMVAVICGTATYALMSFVMTGAPLAMVHHGHSHDHAALGIQWHVLAMFAPSILTGHLITRFGKERIVATGLIILIACGIVALLGLELIHFWGSLILLGLGWNFGFIGATAMVTDTYTPEEKNRAQGANDFILFGSVAFASLLSGFSLNAYGWDFLNWVIFPVAIIALLSLMWLHGRRNTIRET